MVAKVYMLAKSSPTLSGATFSSYPQSSLGLWLLYLFPPLWCIRELSRSLPALLRRIQVPREVGPSSHEMGLLSLT